MRNLFLAALVLECLVLLVLALRKKHAGGFAALAAGTIVLCVVAGVFSVSAGRPLSFPASEQLYMAARLVEQGQPAAALRALALAEEDPQDAGGAGRLRALAYDLCGATATAADCLAGDTTPAGQRLLAQAAAGRAADADLQAEILRETLSALELDAETAARLDAELPLRWLDSTDTSPAAGSEDPLLQLRALLAAGNNGAAYAQALELSDQGGTQWDIVTAEMFVRGFDGRGVAGSDAGYDALLAEVTAARAQADRAALALQDAADGAARRAARTACEQADARYAAALQTLEQEALQRAINYLRNAEPGRARDNIAWQLALASLYSRAGETENAWQCLDAVYAGGAPDAGRWMGREAALLRAAYLHASEDGAGTDWDVVYDQLMSKLYLGLLPAEEDGFAGFLQDYFSATLGAVYISQVDAAAWPRVRVRLAAPGLTLTADALTVTDNGSTVEACTVTKENYEDLSVCVVLDTGAAMGGAGLIMARQAVADLLPELDAPAALVTFAGSARAEAPLAAGNAAALAALGGLQAQGSSNLAAGLRAGAEALAGAPGRRAILLLTTGTGDAGTALPAALAVLQAQNIAVYTVALGSGDTARLQTVAEATGGALFTANDAARLPQALGDAAACLGENWWLEYTAPDAAAAARRLRIRVADTPAEAQKSYEAGAGTASQGCTWLGGSLFADLGAAEGGT